MIVQHITHTKWSRKDKNLWMSYVQNHKKTLPFLFWIFLIQHYNPLRVLFKTQRCFKNSFIFIYCFKINPLFLCFDKISDFCCSTLFLLIQKVRSKKKSNHPASLFVDLFILLYGFTRTLFYVVFLSSFFFFLTHL